MITGVLGLLAVAAAGVAIAASRRPDCFQVQRKIMIYASPDRIFPLLNDLTQWKLWSPWEKKDPAMKKKFGVISAGKDAVYEWEGDKNVGQGRMEITESIAPERLTIKLDFIKPFPAHNIVEFMLVQKGEWTEVTWDMHGPAPFISKLMGMFIDMDKMVGTDFEAGLASMKALTEQKPV